MQRRPILQLPPSVVNRIAAGEVIERPASVVKELIENALDAGASAITVEIEDGGRQLIRVTDDGCGIPPEDLPLAFAPHATNKLACDQDLLQIDTMGFRGEALASIGAVSQARLVSRVAAAEAAYEIEDCGGQIGTPQACAANVGTMVEVRNLFYNTPARRKFLRSPATEAGHISETVLRLALPHPGISFRLISGGRVTLDLPAADAEVRLLAGWPEHFGEQRLSVRAQDAEIIVNGLIGLPELAGPTAKYQFFYLNGRHIRDRFIQHAVREAYRGLIEPGRYPAAILLISMPPQDVDVNVHPTKAEVRFRDSGRIHGLILSCLRERLLGTDLTPTAKAGSAIDEARRTELRQRLAEFFRSQTSAGPSGSCLTGNTLRSDSPLGLTGSHSVSPMLPGSAPGPGPGPGARDADAPLPAAAGSTQASVSAPARPQAIQLHNTYLVTETDDGLIIVDQHALHERIVYEELRQRLSRGPLESQRLLIPDVVPASPAQMALLDQIQPLLGKLGIEVSPFGPGSIAVHAFPSFLHRLEPGRFLRELLERAEQEQLDLHEEEMLHEVLDMMACKAAVKAGDPLSPEEIEALLSRRQMLELSSNCPHGRPTTLRLSLRDLERQFKRTGF